MDTFNDTLENLGRMGEFRRDGLPLFLRFTSVGKKQFQSSPIVEPPRRRRFESGDLGVMGDDEEVDVGLLGPELDPFGLHEKHFCEEREESHSEHFSFVQEDEPEKISLKEEEDIRSFVCEEDDVIKNKNNSTQLSLRSITEEIEPEPEFVDDDVEAAEIKSKNAPIILNEFDEENSTDKPLEGPNIRPEASPFVKMERSCQIFFEYQRERMGVKVGRVCSYWSSKSLLIPNVFRLLRQAKSDESFIQEFQDLSRKEVLVQNNGQKYVPKKRKITKKNRGKQVKRRGSRPG